MRVALLGLLAVAACGPRIVTEAPPPEPPRPASASPARAPSPAPTQPEGAPSAPSPPSTCPTDMRMIPAGKMVFGSPDPRVKNTLREINTLAVCIDRTEVTVAAYRACVAAGRCPAVPTTVYTGDVQPGPDPSDKLCNGARSDREQHPINCVNQAMAEAFCWWRGARLPSEIEWEHAARGGDGRDYPWGSQPPSAERLDACDAECRALSVRLGHDSDVLVRGSDGFETTAPVGSFPAGASPFGVLDLAGNVAEWTSGGACSDAVDTCRSPTRVTRGGSWADGHDAEVRASDRKPRDPAARLPTLGFRCAKAPGP